MTIPVKIEELTSQSIEEEEVDEEVVLPDLDAELLAEVFLAMTRGQESLMIGLDEEAAPRESDSEGAPVLRAAVRVLRASADECAAHDAALADIAKANKGLCLWLPPEPASAG